MHIFIVCMPLGEYFKDWVLKTKLLKIKEEGRKEGGREKRREERGREGRKGYKRKRKKGDEERRTSSLLSLNISELLYLEDHFNDFIQ